jgi:hypothetical protein
LLVCVVRWRIGMEFILITVGLALLITEILIVVGLSHFCINLYVLLQRPGFNPRPVYVGFFRDSVLGQVSSDYIDFPFQFSFHQYSISLI